MPLVAVDQRGPHPGVERANHVRFRLVADVQPEGGIDAQRLERGLEGADIRLFESHQRRGHDQIHSLREIQMDAELGHVAVGVGDDGGLDAGLVQAGRGGQHVGKDPVAAEGESSTAGVSYSAM